MSGQLENQKQLINNIRQLLQEQIELLSELKIKPSALKRYEKKLKQATFNYNRAEDYSSKGKHTTAKKFYKKQ